MFFVTDVLGQQHAYEATRTVVGLRPEAVPGAKRVRSIAVADDHEEQLTNARRRVSTLAYIATPTNERRLLVFVREIMSHPVVHVRADARLVEAQQLLERAHVRHLPVTSARGQVVGLLSQRDALQARVSQQDLGALTVDAVMTHQVLTARPDASIRDAARRMLEARVGSLPITDAEGLPLGIVTRSDILRAVIQRAPLELWG